MSDSKKNIKGLSTGLFTSLSKLTGTPSTSHSLTEAAKGYPVGTIAHWPSGVYQKAKNGNWDLIDPHNKNSPGKKDYYPPGTHLPTSVSNSIVGTKPKGNEVVPATTTSPTNPVKDLADKLPPKEAEPVVSTPAPVATTPAKPVHPPVKLPAGIPSFPDIDHEDEDAPMDYHVWGVKFAKSIYTMLGLSEFIPSAVIEKLKSRPDVVAALDAEYGEGWFAKYSDAYLLHKLNATLKGKMTPEQYAKNSTQNAWMTKVFDANWVQNYKKLKAGAEIGSIGSSPVKGAAPAVVAAPAAAPAPVATPPTPAPVSTPPAEPEYKTGPAKALKKILAQGNGLFLAFDKALSVQLSPEKTAFDSLFANNPEVNEIATKALGSHWKDEYKKFKGWAQPEEGPKAHKDFVAVLGGWSTLGKAMVLAAASKAGFEPNSAEEKFLFLLKNKDGSKEEAESSLQAAGWSPDEAKQFADGVIFKASAAGVLTKSTNAFGNPSYDIEGVPVFGHEIYKDAGNGVSYQQMAAYFNLLTHGSPNSDVIPSDVMDKSFIGLAMKEKFGPDWKAKLQKLDLDALHTVPPTPVPYDTGALVTAVKKKLAELGVYSVNDIPTNSTAHVELNQKFGAGWRAVYKAAVTLGSYLSSPTAKKIHKLVYADGQSFFSALDSALSVHADPKAAFEGLSGDSELDAIGTNSQGPDWKAKYIQHKGWDIEKPVAGFAFPNVNALKNEGSAKAKLGGNKPKYFLADPKNPSEKYLFKTAEGSKSRAYAGQAASEVAHMILGTAGAAEFVPVKATTHKDLGFGTIQPIFPNDGTLEETPVTDLDPYQVKALLRERVIDWAIANHDSKAGNFIKLPNGEIVGIDKEQAFKLIGQDELSLTYKPNPSPPVYNALFKAWVDKKILLNPNDALPFIQMAEAVSDDTWLAGVEPYLKTAPSDLGISEDLLKKRILDRKHSLRKDFETFFTKLLKQRGELPLTGSFKFSDSPPEPVAAPAFDTGVPDDADAKNGLIHKLKDALGLWSNKDLMAAAEALINTAGDDGINIQAAKDLLTQYGHTPDNAMKTVAAVFNAAAEKGIFKPVEKPDSSVLSKYITVVNAQNLATAVENAKKKKPIDPLTIDKAIKLLGFETSSWEAVALKVLLNDPEDVVAAKDTLKELGKTPSDAAKIAIAVHDKALKTGLFYVDTDATVIDWTKLNGFEPSEPGTEIEYDDATLAMASKTGFTKTDHKTAIALALKFAGSGSDVTTLTKELQKANKDSTSFEYYKGIAEDVLTMMEANGWLKVHENGTWSLDKPFPAPSFYAPNHPVAGSASTTKTAIPQAVINAVGDETGWVNPEYFEMIGHILNAAGTKENLADVIKKFEANNPASKDSSASIAATAFSKLAQMGYIKPKTTGDGTWELDKPLPVVTPAQTYSDTIEAVSKLIGWSGEISHKVIQQFAADPNQSAAEVASKLKKDIPAPMHAVIKNVSDIMNAMIAKGVLVDDPSTGLSKFDPSKALAAAPSQISPETVQAVADYIGWAGDAAEKAIQLIAAEPNASHYELGKKLHNLLPSTSLGAAETLVYNIKSAMLDKKVVHNDQDTLGYKFDPSAVTKTGTLTPDVLAGVFHLAGLPLSGTGSAPATYKKIVLALAKDPSLGASVKELALAATGNDFYASTYSSENAITALSKVGILKKDADGKYSFDTSNVLNYIDYGGKKLEGPTVTYLKKALKYKQGGMNLVALQYLKNHTTGSAAIYAYGVEHPNASMLDKEKFKAALKKVAKDLKEKNLAEIQSFLSPQSLKIIHWEGFSSDVASPPNLSPSNASTKTAPAYTPPKPAYTPPAPQSYKKPPKGDPLASLPTIPGLPNVQSLSVSDSKLASAIKGQGAGQKEVFKDGNGNEYIFKFATKKGSKEPQPFRVAGQVAFSALALELKPYHVKVGASTLDGLPGTLQNVLKLGSPAEIGKGFDPDNLTTQEKEDVASEHILDWVMSQHDSHGSNLMRTADGHIVGIDKEQAFKYFYDKNTGKFDADKLSIDYHPNSAYGESEPYYNKFWRAFSENKLDFDPKVLGQYFETLNGVSGALYEKSITPYAELAFPKDAAKQAEFIQAAKNRKATAKQDFEKFITGLYRKREDQDGKFTFKDGWVPVGPPKSKKPEKKVEPPPPPPKTVKKKVNLQSVLTPGEDGYGTIAGAEGLKVSEHKPKTQPPDPTLATLKLPKSSSVDALKKFIADNGITTVGDVVTGSNYHLVVVKKADLQKEVEIEVDNPAYIAYVDAQNAEKNAALNKKAPALPPHPLTPEYLPAIKLTPTPPNVEELDDVPSLKNLGAGGKTFMVGGLGVESHALKVKRVINKKGEEEYFVHFKLRPPLSESIIGSYKSDPIKFPAGGQGSTFEFPQGKYDPVKDALVESSTVDFTPATHKWSADGNEIHVVDGGYYYNWSFAGGVYSRLKLKNGESLKGALTKLLDKIKPGLAGEVLRNPTEEERKIKKLAALLKTEAPQVAQKLTSPGFTVSNLTNLLDASKIPHNVDDIIEVEACPGQTVPAIHNRWKEVSKNADGSPGVKMVVYGVNTPANIANMFANGVVAGNHERLISGVSANVGASTGTEGGTKATHADGLSGGSDVLMTRVIVQKHMGSTLSAVHGGVGGSAPYKIVFAPDVLDRLDVTLHKSDQYGATNPVAGGHESAVQTLGGITKLLTSYNSPSSYGNEVSTNHELCFKRGIGTDKVVRIACKYEHEREAMVQALKDRGITEVNGIPVEEFVVPTQDITKLVNNFMKPLGY